MQLSPKQREARDVIARHRSTLLVGGSRAGKTVLALRTILIRAMRKPSRHVVARLRFNHVKRSVGMDTMPKVVAGFFPGLRVRPHKTEWYFPVPCESGGTSEIWLAGLDDKERTEKILGTEYSTLFLNEASQIPYESVLTLRTRLAENSGLPMREIIDCNPPSKKHWTYSEYILGVVPGKLEKHTRDVGHIFMNPKDNLANLPPGYIEELNAMPKRQRERFLLGMFLDDVEGALWKHDDLVRAKSIEPGARRETVIAVDPAVTGNNSSDEHGIVVCSLTDQRTGVVERDLSFRGPVDKMAQRVVNAYKEYKASVVVVEVNNGGDLIESLLRQYDRSVKIVKVRASVGKLARAEPVSALYDQGLVAHVGDMPELEDQMTTYVPATARNSPDRLDAVVWGLTYLIVDRSGRSRVHA